MTSPGDPLVEQRLRGVDLVLGYDEASWQVLARLPVPEASHVAILADAVPWMDLYGRGFSPFDTWWCDSGSGLVQSTLRVAALMGYVLQLGAPGSGLRPIELVLSTFDPPDLSAIPPSPHEEIIHVRT